MIRRPAWAVLFLIIALLGLSAPANASPPPTRTITPGHSKPPKGGTTSTGLGLRPGNSNAQLAENIPSRVRRSWAASPRRALCRANGNDTLEFGTKTTATNRTYTVALHTGACDVVTAYRTKNGKPVWSAAFPQAWSMVSDGTYVYVHWQTVVDDSMRQLITALKISNGKIRWTVASSAVQEELSVGSGVVVSGVGVHDAKTGRLRFGIPTQGFNSFEPRTLVVKGMLVRNNHDVVDAWTPKGRLLWRYTKRTYPDGPGAGELMPQYDGGRIYVRDDSGTRPGTLVLDARTGRRLADLPHADRPLAFDGRVGIVTVDVPDETDATSVSAVDLRDGHVYWSRTYRGEHTAGGRLIRSEPVVENGLVWFGLSAIGSQPLRLVALDERTGTTRARISETCRLRGHSPRSFDAVGGSIGIAQHRLFVPSSCGLQTYVAQR